MWVTKFCKHTLRKIFFVIVKVMRNGIVVAIIVLGLLIGLFLSKKQTVPSVPSPTQKLVISPPKNAIEAKITKVFDGDTVEINGTEKLRYIGIDAPETTSNTCFAQEAKKKNSDLVLGKTVWLATDVSDVDAYNRKLRYVYLPDGTFINKILVEEGYAKTFPVKPDVQYADLFSTGETEARKNQKGLWGSCRGNTQIIVPTPLPGCTIKGNKTTDSKRVYHTQQCPDYKNTQIDISRGDFWFCSEQEALINGFTKAKNCPE
jgi:micrococcal nuclease